MQNKKLPEYFKNKCEENKVESPANPPQEKKVEKPEYMGEKQKYVPMLNLNMFDALLEEDL